MLVLTRRIGESIKIGDDIVVKILGRNSGQIKVGIEAPKSVDIVRFELLEDEHADRERPDWSRKCSCGATPIVPSTGMCGPCTFGEADTANGNW